MRPAVRSISTCAGRTTRSSRGFPKATPAPVEPEAQASEPRGRGRPKLGVVAREVTLLPRHWEWLNAQPGGASVALRKLVDEARRANGDRDRQRAARDAAYHFMSTMAGNLANFEEASRALFADDRRRFAGLIADWPPISEITSSNSPTAIAPTSAIVKTLGALDLTQQTARYNMTVIIAPAAEPPEQKIEGRSP